MSWVTTREAAEKAGVSPSVMHRWIHNKQVESRKVKGGRGPGYSYQVNTSTLPKANTNGHAPATGDGDPYIRALDNLILSARNLKRELRNHDEKVRRDTIKEVGASLVEGAGR